MQLHKGRSAQNSIAQAPATGAHSAVPNSAESAALKPVTIKAEKVATTITREPAPSHWYDDPVGSRGM